jgi:hypothetical protein
MNVVVINVPYAWDMLMLIIWCTTLGGFLSMDLTHVHIPKISYSQPVAKNHVVDLNSPDYWSDFEYDVTPHAIEYDPLDLPFAQENCIDTLLLNIDKYKKNI